MPTSARSRPSTIDPDVRDRDGRRPHTTRASGFENAKGVLGARHPRLLQARTRRGVRWWLDMMHHVSPDHGVGTRPLEDTVDRVRGDPAGRLIAELRALELDVSRFDAD